jgi:hypothetical protein
MREDTQKLFECYQNILLTEAFKSTILSDVFNAAKYKKVNKYNYETGKYEDTTDNSYVRQLKRTIGYILSRMDASNITNDEVEIIKPDVLRKKVNKAKYMFAIGLTDKIPQYVVKFYDDGTINSVDAVSNSEYKANFKRALEYSDEFVVIDNIKDWFKVGAGKNKERYIAKTDALAFKYDYDVKRANLERYKKAMAEVKSSDPKIDASLVKLKDVYNQILVAMSSVDLSKYSSYDQPKFIKNLENVVKLIGNFNNLEKDISYGYKSKNDISSMVASTEKLISDFQKTNRPVFFL